MLTPERLDWLRLSRTENVGPITFHQLISRYGSARAALEAIPELAARGGLKRKLTIPGHSTLEMELAKLDQLGGKLLLSCDADYPHLLGQLSDAPPVLTVLGHSSLLNSKPCVAIIGARNASLNGRRLAEKLARDLGAAGWVVVSGLAAGIDGAAHQGALASGTVAVIAGGLESIYPPENEKLHAAIAQQGCILAEMPIGTPINARLFPRRNRIVSGLCRGVVVIEASLKSGSLITARLAAEQGREVMAVPGSPLDPRAGGTNKLIKEGAALIETAQDVLDHLSGLPYAAETKAPTYNSQPSVNTDENSLNALRPKILDALSYTPVEIDEIVRLCQTPPFMVLAILLELELAGHLVRLPGNRVALVAADNAAVGSWG